MAEFCLYLRCDLGLSVPAVKGYWVALNHVFSLADTDLASNTVVSRMLRNFKKSCSSGEVWPPDWNLSFLDVCLSHLLSLLSWLLTNISPGRHPFLVVLASAKRVSELHGLFFHVDHSWCWRSCTFSFLPNFIAKIQNPSVPDPRFDEFMVPSLDDFVDGNG